MSHNKHKRKAHKQRQRSTVKTHKISLLARYPRQFFALGVLMMMVAIALLTVGYVSHAKVGVAMLSLFFGIGLVIFANAAMPKQ